MTLENRDPSSLRQASFQFVYDAMKKFRAGAHHSSRASEPKCVLPCRR